MRGSGIALAVLLVAGAAGAQKRFEGTITYKLTTPDGNSATTTLAQKGTKIRQERPLPMGQTAASIMDSETGDVIMLIPGQKQYMTLTAKQMQEQVGAPPPDSTKVKVTPTGKKDKIAGIPCETYRMESPGGSPVEICAAKGMGTIGVLGNTPGMGPADANPNRNPELMKLQKEGFLPLRTVVTEAGGGKGMVMEATRVDRTPPDASLFAPPPGSTRMDPSQMQPGMGGPPGPRQPPGPQQQPGPLRPPGK